jgi:pyruvate/2-oxoglutarate dehydrogenase complex dihydrolipoamide dehydrogenase (E3) component
MVISTSQTTGPWELIMKMLIVGASVIGTVYGAHVAAAGS